MAQVNATHPGNPVNDGGGHAPNHYSKYTQRYNFGTTYRFGENGICYVMDTNRNDKLSFHNGTNVRSFNLKAPLMQDIRMHKDFFNVPMEAILPFNWDIWYDNPTIGDDVPAMVNASHTNFMNTIGQIWDGITADYLQDGYDGDALYWVAPERPLQAALFLEMLFSQGSLIANLGCKLEQFLKFNNSDMNIDKFIQLVMDGYKTKSFAIKFIPSNETFHVNKNGLNSNRITWHECLERCRQNLNFEITPDERLEDWVTPNTFTNDDEENGFSIVRTANEPIDLARLHAYQIVNAHYYSNDQIDYVFSAQMYRDYIASIYHEAAEAVDGYAEIPTFNYNGMKKPYDWCSGHIFDAIAKLYYNNDPLGFGTGALAKYLTAVFSFRKSLRFVDYFTGGRANPIAIGQNGVSVNNNQVSVIDITREIQGQRFRNAVQRVGRKFENYLEGIMPGKKVAYDYHNPAWLISTSDTIFSSETENTAADQLEKANTTTSNLRLETNKYAFQFESDRPSIIIGICYFDIERMYTQAIERQFFVKHRFDMFNNFLQLTGDQGIYREEIGRVQKQNGNAALTNFAYTMKYQEYRTRFSQAAGGFIRHLPGWAFLDSMSQESEWKAANISPEFIRSHNSELDPLFNVLEGDTLEGYFHFQVLNTNTTEARRQMIAKPSIM